MPISWPEKCRTLKYSPTNSVSNGRGIVSQSCWQRRGKDCWAGKSMRCPFISLSISANTGKLVFFLSPILKGIPTYGIQESNFLCDLRQIINPFWAIVSSFIKLIEWFGPDDTRWLVKRKEPEERISWQILAIWLWLTNLLILGFPVCKGGELDTFRLLLALKVSDSQKRTEGSQVRLSPENQQTIPIFMEYIKG